MHLDHHFQVSLAFLSNQDICVIYAANISVRDRHSRYQNHIQLFPSSDVSQCRICDTLSNHVPLPAYILVEGRMIEERTQAKRYCLRLRCPAATTLLSDNRPVARTFSLNRQIRDAVIRTPDLLCIMKEASRFDRVDIFQWHD